MKTEAEVEASGCGQGARGVKGELDVSLHETPRTLFIGAKGIGKLAWKNDQQKLYICYKTGPKGLCKGRTPQIQKGVGPKRTRWNTRKPEVTRAVGGSPRGEQEKRTHSSRDSKFTIDRAFNPVPGERGSSRLEKG